MSENHTFQASTCGSVMAEHPRTLRADQQRRTAGARRSRQELAVAGLVEPAVEVDGALAKQRPDDRERLLEAVDAVVEREAEGAKLGLVPAGAEPEHEATAADLVDRGGLLGQQRRVVEVRARHERPELDPGGDGGDGAHQRPCLPRPARIAVGPAIEEVLAEPDRVEAEVLDGPHQVEQLRPANLALDLGQLDPDLDRSCAHRPARATRIAARWSGVLPQQAPMIRAPASHISIAVPAIISGLAR